VREERRSWAWNRDGATRHQKESARGAQAEEQYANKPEFDEVVSRLPETRLDWVLVAIRCEARFTPWTMTGTEFCAEAIETGDASWRAK